MNLRGMDVSRLEMSLINVGDITEVVPQINEHYQEKKERAIFTAMCLFNLESEALNETVLKSLFFLIANCKSLRKEIVQKALDRLRPVGKKLNEEGVKCSDAKMSFELFKKAELRFNPMACFNAGNSLFFDSKQSTDTSQAEKHWSMGSTIAKRFGYEGWEDEPSNVGRVEKYLTYPGLDKWRWDVPLHVFKAMELFVVKKTLNPFAYMFCGRALEEGRGIEKNQAKADAILKQGFNAYGVMAETETKEWPVPYYQRAIDLGNTMACFNLGNFLAFSAGNNCNVGKAFECWKIGLLQASNPDQSWKSEPSNIPLIKSFDQELFKETVSDEDFNAFMMAADLIKEQSKTINRLLYYQIGRAKCLKGRTPEEKEEGRKLVCDTAVAICKDKNSHDVLGKLKYLKIAAFYGDINSCFRLGTYILAHPESEKDLGDCLHFFHKGHFLLQKAKDKSCFDREFSFDSFPKVVSLKGKEALNSIASGFGFVLSQVSVLTTLDLSSTNLGPEGLKQLSEGLKAHSSLTSLNLSDNSIGSEGAASLSEALKDNKELIHLDLSFNDISSEGIESLSGVLKRNTSLTVLSLEGNRFRVSGAKILAECLEKSSKLKELRLGGTHMGEDGLMHLSESLKNAKSLSCLSLWGNCLGTGKLVGIRNLLLNIPSLVHLDLWRNELGSDSAIQIASYLKGNVALRTLILSENHIGDEGANAIWKSVGKSALEELYMDGNDISGKGLDGISDALSSSQSLKVVNMEGNPCGKITPPKRRKVTIVQ